MKRNETLRVAIDRLTPSGNGLAVVEGRSVEVRGALPGDVVDVRILALKRHSARARLEGIVEDGIGRVDAACGHFGQCGGCMWQNVPYGEQCKLKAGLVARALESLSAPRADDEIEFVPSPDVYFYRNKMEFSFDSPPGESGCVMLGLHEKGRYDRVFDVRQCLLQSELSNRVVEHTRAFAEEHRLPVYGLKSHTGLLRYLVIRDGKQTGDLMANLVTSGEEFPMVHDYADFITRSVPSITSVLRSINRRSASVATGDELEILSGKGTLTERIGDFVFSLSPDSFFQTNTVQARNLYDTIRSFCRPDGTQLLDLYCGTGTIGLYCSGEAGTVTGIELVPAAVQDARENALKNGVSNCRFIEGQVEKTLRDMTEKFDVVICDPPRAGIHPKALDVLLHLRIPRMVYVSCNVNALSSDLESLALAGYRIGKVRAFDMSPHTPHIETVVLLEIV